MAQWLPEAHAAAVALWQGGREARVVAQALRDDLGVVVSKSAIIGRMRRAGIAQGYCVARIERRRLDNIARLALAAARPAPAPAPERQPVRKAPPRAPTPPPPRGVGPPKAAFRGDTVPPPGGVLLREARTQQCRFIAGAPGADAVCCGAATYPRTSWCPAHTRLVYQAGTARRR